MSNQQSNPRESLPYWESYYKNHPNPGVESPFAQFVTPFLTAGDRLYELGCGNGRDSVFFASRGVHVTAFDQCTNELDHLNKEAAQTNLTFESGDFTRLGERDPVNAIYSRFTLHSVDLAGETRTLNWAHGALNLGGLFFIEIRSVKDDLYGQGTQIGPDEFITTHYRRFVELNAFVSRIESAGFRVLYRLESNGLAPHPSEDPVVIRVIAQR